MNRTPLNREFFPDARGLPPGKIPNVSPHSVPWSLVRTEFGTGLGVFMKCNPLSGTLWVIWARPEESAESLLERAVLAARVIGENRKALARLASD